ncbi:MAG: hypothetical protein FJY67_00575 [Calditrichaeota bacterium]|nr:hypothetical protein [Calditrichota bacterium]
MKNTISYSDAIERVMLENGGFASLRLIYQEFLKYRSLTGKTPDKTIQERVQRDPRFKRIGVGVYALAKHSFVSEPVPVEQIAFKEFQHTHIQGMLLELGEFKGFKTYSNDKSKKFNGKSLANICTVRECPRFTYDEIIDRSARFFDVIWFQDARSNPPPILYPISIFEVEHSTDFRSALLKFDELRYFRTQFNVVAPQDRFRKFESEKRKEAYRIIGPNVNFLSYEKITEIYAELEQDQARKQLYSEVFGV